MTHMLPGGVFLGLWPWAGCEREECAGDLRRFGQRTTWRYGGSESFCGKDEQVWGRPTSGLGE
jgi:hypothetical protein